MMMENHYFHLVNPSPWPILLSLSLLNLGASIIEWLSVSNSSVMFFLLFFINSSAIAWQWWRDVIREALYEGIRSTKINLMISTGVILFIVSEICFFSSFFWAYFDYSLSSSASTSLDSWPPKGVYFVSNLGIPLLNTLILLGSGFFITWCHYSILKCDFYSSKMTLMFCVFLGVYFILIQMYEYFNLSFSFSESVFGSSFFILTGFHGFHVLVGLIFIFVNLIRLMLNSFSSVSLLGLEYSIWYWHFVDLVWLFLYCFVYWWGS